MLSYGQQQKMQHYFPMPNEIFHLDLSDGTILVYAFLMYCEDRKTYQCYPSYATIGKAIKRSENSVAKYVRELEERRLIHTEPTEVTLKDGRKHNGTLLYTIRPIAEAVEYAYEQQMLRLQAECRHQKVMQKLQKTQGSIKKQEKA